MRVLLLVLLIPVLCHAQEKTSPDPVIGEQFINYTFKDVQNFNRNSFPTSGAKGKWLIIDFWDELCASCINSFPEISRIHAKYLDKLSILSVGYTGEMVAGHKSSIKQLWNRLNSKYHFKFPVAFDSVLFNRFGIGAVGCPYIVIIDPNNIVRAVVGGLKERDVDLILQNDLSSLRPIGRLMQKVNWRIPEKQIFGNALSEWAENMYSVSVPNLWNDTSRSEKLQLIGVPLEWLYRYAYTGNGDWDNPDNEFYNNFLYHPILKVKDSSKFDRDKLYTYNFKLPKKIAKSEITLELRDALSKAFGYTVTIEARIEPYWRITLIDSLKSRLISKGGLQKFEDNGKFMGFTARNYPLSNLVNQLWGHFQLHTRPGLSGLTVPGRPFIDETGLKENIDISIDAFIEDFEEFRNALLKNGIKIEEGHKLMKCIVISDAR